MSTPRTTVGPYRLEDVLGEGGMGRVYRAWDRRLERYVAVKHIRPDVAHNEMHRARFRREAWAVARLNHPSIVHIYDILENEAGDWIVMELVGGPTLESMVARGPLEARYAAAYGRQIAEGLAEAHDKGIVHRDLKTENVLIAPSGQAKILDFGLAKPLVRKADEQTLSMIGAVIGTCRSMSPEQAEGTEVGPASDLFSLGTLLYEVSTGISPFKAATSVETLARVISHRPEPAHRVSSQVPRQLSQLISQLMVKDPHRRPLSAALVAVELAEVEASQASSVGPRGPVGDHNTLEVRRESLPQAQLKAPVRQKARRSKGRQRRVWIAVAILIGLAGLAWWLFNRADPPPSKAEFPAAPRGVDRLDPISASNRSDAVSEKALATSRDRLRSLDRGELQHQGTALLARYDQPGHLDQAVAMFQEILRRDSADAEAHAGLARAYIYRFYNESRDPAWLDLALPTALKAYEIDRLSVSALISLGLVYVALGRDEEARKHLNQALLLDSGQADAYAGLGNLYLARGEIEDAKRAYQKACEINPQQRRYHDLLGSVFFRQGRFDEAATAFKRSIEAAPNSIFGYRNLSGVHAAQGNFEEAVALLQKALEIQPHATLFSNLGTYLFLQGLYAQSVNAFERALGLPGGANNPLTWGNLGDAYRWTIGESSKTQQAYARAVQLLDEALERQPNDPTLLSRRALYQARRGDCEASKRDLADLAAINDIQLDYRQVLTAESCRDREAALEHLERALTRGYPLSEARKDPELFELRSDPRYHLLASRYESNS